MEKCMSNGKVFFATLLAAAALSLSAQAGVLLSADELKSDKGTYNAVGTPATSFEIEVKAADAVKLEGRASISMRYRRIAEKSGGDFIRLEAVLPRGVLNLKDKPAYLHISSPEHPSFCNAYLLLESPGANAVLKLPDFKKTKDGFVAIELNGESLIALSGTKQKLDPSIITRIFLGIANVPVNQGGIVYMDAITSAPLAPVLNPSANTVTAPVVKEAVVTAPASASTPSAEGKPYSYISVTDGSNVSVDYKAMIADYQARDMLAVPKTDAAVKAASKIRFDIPVMCREWHIWYGSPHGIDPIVPTWSHWKGQTIFHKFNPATTIEETVPGLAWRRWVSTTGIPMLGAYDSSQRDIIRWQIETAKNAGIECLHIHLWPSLWDAGTDFTPIQIFETALEEAQKLGCTIAVHDEIMFRRPNITKAQLIANSALRTGTLVKRYGKHPGWYKIDGQPVYYFQNWSKWISNANDMETYFAETEKMSGPVHWMVEMSPAEDFWKIPQIKTVLGPNNSGFIHKPPYGAGPHPWDELDSGLASASEMAKKYGKKFGILVYPRFNNNHDRSTPGRGRIDAEDGMFFVKALEIAKKNNPDYLVLTQWNDFEESGFFEPGWDFDGYNGDPFRYLHIVAAAKGVKFTPAQLPVRESVDPFVRHKLFGDTKPGDMGPVFHGAQVKGTALEFQWARGSGDPATMRFCQSKLIRWTPGDAAFGQLRIANPTVSANGELNAKNEFRLYAPALARTAPQTLWLGIRTRCPDKTSIIAEYRSVMENYRVDSRWERRKAGTAGSPFIDLGAEKFYWFPMHGTAFTGAEGDITLKLGGDKKDAVVSEAVIWHAGMNEASIPVAWKNASVALPAGVDGAGVFVATAYDTAGNAGIPRLLVGGKTLPLPIE
ncbi:MAG: hypothetical protein HZC28_15760 [Spirochaetes bacterium]|nr:hypothetical protein [Spirochaetota bacterium]